VLDKQVENGSTPLSARLLFSTNPVKNSKFSDGIEDELSNQNRRVLVETQDVLLL